MPDEPIVAAPEKTRGPFTVDFVRRRVLWPKDVRITLGVSAALVLSVLVGFGGPSDVHAVIAALVATVIALAACLGLAYWHAPGWTTQDRCERGLTRHLVAALPPTKPISAEERARRDEERARAVEEDNYSIFLRMYRDRLRAELCGTWLRSDKRD